MVDAFDMELSPEGRDEGKELPEWQGKLTTGELYMRMRPPGAKVLVQMRSCALLLSCVGLLFSCWISA
jgi:hypothetical protein